MSEVQPKIAMLCALARNSGKPRITYDGFIWILKDGRGVPVAGSHILEALVLLAYGQTKDLVTR